MGLCRALGAGQDLKSFDVDNKFGLEALKRIMEDCCGDSSPLVEVSITHGHTNISSSPSVLHTCTSSLRKIGSKLPFSYDV